MTEIIVHIGTHKTGSTAIQAALGKNTHLLMTHGYHFVPESFWYPSFLQELLTGDMQNLDKEKERYQRVIENAKARKLIFSSEGFSGSFFKGYSNTPDIARNLHHIIGSHEVKIVIYLRRQDHLNESTYTHYIHTGESWSFEDFKHDWSLHIDWHRPLMEYAKCFGDENIVVRIYEKTQLEHGNVVSDFFNILRIPLQIDGPEDDQRPNRSYSRTATELARICNRSFDNDQRIRLRRLLQATNYRDPLEDFSLYTSRERQELLARHEQSNAEVARRFLGRADGRLFLEPLSEHDSFSNGERNGLTTDELAVLVMNIFVRKHEVARGQKAYTLVLIEEMEKLMLRLLDTFRLKHLAYRVAKSVLGLIRRVRSA